MYDQVEYRDCPGFPGYRVGSDGSLLSSRKGPWRPVKPYGNGRGYVYPAYSMYRGNGRRVVRKAHSLVLEAFVGPRPDGMECRHLNDCKWDNRLANLRWGTRDENAADRARNGVAPIGEKNGIAKLTEEDVREIRAMKAAGQLDRVIAEKFSVHDSLISLIHLRKVWRHV